MKPAKYGEHLICTVFVTHFFQRQLKYSASVYQDIMLQDVYFILYIMMTCSTVNLH